MSGNDYLPEIVYELDTLYRHEQKEGNKFKASAYKKVLDQLRKLKRVDTIEDISKVIGIGKGIRERIEEILRTGHLKETDALHKAEIERQKVEWQKHQAAQPAAQPPAPQEGERAEGDGEAELEMQKQRQQEQQALWKQQHDIKQRAAAIETLKNVHGIGPVAAKNLVEVHKIMSIDELREKSATDASLLNATQKKGLFYYYQFMKRIPREEMKAHSKILKQIMKSKYPTLEIDVVGSYRRGELTSGDIDVLIKLPSDKTVDFGKQVLTDIVEQMKTQNYIVDTLALGKKKFFGVSKVGETAPVRRLDIMITPEAHYGFAIMYFTGSMKFNIGVRRIALEKGYSMNEYGFTPKAGVAPAPLLKSEEEIFEFLGLKMIKPKYRIDESILEKKVLKAKK